MKTLEQIKADYSDYLRQHIENVNKSYKWLVDHHIVDYSEELSDQIAHHDQSKYSDDEFIPYAIYFYGEEKTEEVSHNFELAWNHHQKRNPHHWEYWVLIGDLSDSVSYNALPIPDNYIIEMICDWWSFSWKSGNLNEIFNWYDQNKDLFIMHKNSKNKVESLLARIKQELNHELVEESFRNGEVQEIKDIEYNITQKQVRNGTYSPANIHSNHMAAVHIHEKQVAKKQKREEDQKDEKLQKEQLPEFRTINGEKHILTDGGTYEKVDDDYDDTNEALKSTNSKLIIETFTRIINDFQGDECVSMLEGLKRKFNLDDDKYKKYEKIVMKKVYNLDESIEDHYKHIKKNKKDI